MTGEPLPVCRVAELDEPEDQTPWLVEALWSRAAVGFVAGQPKLGKTWLALDLALSVPTVEPTGLDPLAQILHAHYERTQPIPRASRANPTHDPKKED